MPVFLSVKHNKFLPLTSTVQISVAGKFLLGARFFFKQREDRSTPGRFQESVLVKRSENIVLDIVPREGS